MLWIGTISKSLYIAANKHINTNYRQQIDFLTYLTLNIHINEPLPGTVNLALRSTAQCFHLVNLIT